MRINKVSIIVGGRGSGKTDFVKNLIYLIPKRRIICDTFDSPVWKNYGTFLHPERSNEAINQISFNQIQGTEKSTYKLISSDTDKIFSAIKNDAWNSLIVVEDATRFISKQLDKSVRTFVLDTKQKNLDLIFIFHSLRDVPPDLIRWSDTLTLFKTNETFTNYMRNKYPNQAIENAFEKIKTYPNFKPITVHIGG